MEDLNNIDRNIREFEKNKIKQSTKAPKGYFDGFQDKIHAKVYHEPRKIFWLKSLGFGTLVTAVAVVAVMLLTPKSNGALEEIQSEDIAAYYQENIDLLTLEDVYEVAPEEVIEEIGEEINANSNDQAIEETETVVLDSISKEDIIDYLLEEDIETLDWEYL